MKRILLMIHSASHEIYQRNVKALLEGYLDMLNKDGLQIDISAYCGVCDDPDHEYSEGTVSWINEKEVNEVYFDVMSRVSKLEKYDIIIKTNTNTVLNLPLVYAFCNSNNFNPNIFYTSVGFGIEDYDGRGLSYPSGMFIMADRHLWERIIDEYIPTREYIDQVESVTQHYGIKHTPDESNNQLVWTGYSDEFVTGVILRRLQIPIATLNSSSISSWKTNFFSELIAQKIYFDQICDNYISINCKLDITGDLEFGSMEESFRIQYEHIFITAICKLLGNHNPTINDVNNLVNAVHKLF